MQFKNDVLLQIFKFIMRFCILVRMKTETGYVYFMYNPFTGLPDSDSSDSFDDDDSCKKHSSRKCEILFLCSFNILFRCRKIIICCFEFFVNIILLLLLCFGSDSLG